MKILNSPQWRLFSRPALLLRSATAPAAALRSGLAVVIVLVLNLLPGAAAQAQPDPGGQRAEIEIIRLENRRASVLREAVEPFLDSRGDISVIDNNLIISTSAANLAELRDLIRQLDVPRRQLRVSVDFDYRPPSPAGTATTRDLDRGSAVQQIRVQEGETAFLSRSDSESATVLHADSISLWLSRQEVESEAQSLLVSAEVFGDNARLSVETLSRSQTGGDSDGLERESATTLTLPVGQWTLIRDLNPPPDETSGGSDEESTFRASTEELSPQNDGDRLAVRVEVLD